MADYLVRFEQVVYFEVEVEADSKDEAEEMVYDGDYPNTPFEIDRAFPSNVVATLDE